MVDSLLLPNAETFSAITSLSSCHWRLKTHARSVTNLLKCLNITHLYIFKKNGSCFFSLNDWTNNLITPILSIFRSGVFSDF